MSITPSYKTLQEFKEALDNKGLRALDELYLQFKNEFYVYCSTYNLQIHEIQDIYQDAIIVFYENVISGKLSIMTSSLKTYIFSIGKYSAYNVIKNKNKMVELERSHLENLNLSYFEDEDETGSKREMLNSAFKNLGENCREILVLFYYHAYTIEDLTAYLKYKNENVVRSHKSRCLRTLKDLVKLENSKMK